MICANAWRPTEARISLKALRHNLAIARSLTSHKLIAVVKANGYGHGLKEVALALEDADAFAVATLEEAVSLRSVIPAKDIIVLQGFYDKTEPSYFAAHNLIAVIHSPDQLAMLSTSDLALRLVLEYNSGMNRLGLTKKELHEAIGVLKARPQWQLVFAMTHFHSANQVDTASSLRQLEDFDDALRGFDLPRSLCNSAALINLPAARADYDRPGLMLYGASPLDTRPANAIGLKPAMTLVSRLVAIHRLKAGDRVGYEGVWSASGDCRVGTVPLGYGDGYPRIGHRAQVPVLVNGCKCNLSGRVSMDLLSVDLSYCENARVGDEVILWGEGLAVEEVATAVGRIAYDLLAGLTARLRRVYH